MRNDRRLDIDWRWIQYALEKNVLISVNPDAHSLNGIDDIKYGVFSAQKAMLPKEKNLSKREEQLRKQFSKMEETMSKLQGQGAAAQASLVGGGR